MGCDAGQILSWNLVGKAYIFCMRYIVGDIEGTLASTHGTADGGGRTLAHEDDQYTAVVRAYVLL